MKTPRVLTGLDRITVDPTIAHIVKDRKIGVVAHPASINHRWMHARDVLLSVGAKISVLFGPEHGFGGEAQDMIGVEGAIDRVTHAPIYSLYGHSLESLTPKREWLDGLDAVVIDLQDIGSRYYTFVWTAVLVARACSTAGVETIILDRPNPINGMDVEGTPQTPELLSFVGLRSIPIRHGLTIGEIVQSAAHEEKLSGVRIVPMQGWQRSMFFDETEQPWVLPSPNMPTLDTALVYPGGCLMEGTTLSEGRGTTRPFEIFGGPNIHGNDLATWLHQHGGEGFYARALTFQPTFHKHAKQLCGGVQIHVTDRRAFRPFRTYIAALSYFAKQPGFSWRKDAYEFVENHPAIDLLTGDSRIREGIEQGAAVADILQVGATRMSTWSQPNARWLYP